MSINTISLSDIVVTIKKITKDPIEAERRIGTLYGQIFKRKERVYDGNCIECGRNIYFCIDSPCVD